MFIISLLPGVWSEIKLDQSPSQVKTPGETVKMSCVMSGFKMTDYFIALDTAEARGKLWSGSGRMNAGSNSADLWQLLSKPFHHDWGCFQQHSVPSGRESDSRRCCCLLLCSTATMTEDSGAAEQKPPQTTSSIEISVTSVFPQVM